MLELSAVGLAKSPESNLLIEVMPSGVHAVDQLLFLQAVSSLYSFLFSDRFEDSIKPFVIDKLYTVISRGKTAGVGLFLMLATLAARFDVTPTYNVVLFMLHMM